MTQSCVFTCKQCVRLIKIRNITQRLPNVDYLATEMTFAVDILDYKKQESILPERVEETGILTSLQDRIQFSIPIPPSFNNRKLRYSIWVILSK